MQSNATMTHYFDSESGSHYWIADSEIPRPGWTLVEDDPNVPLPDPNYVPPYPARRMSAYPPITEQLDMLWHAMDQDPALRLEPFYSTIQAVKLSIPKD